MKKLTARDKQILQKLATGARIKEVATSNYAAYSVTERLRKKLGAKTLFHAGVIAVKEAIV